MNVIETADQKGETTTVDVDVTAETKDVVAALTSTDVEVSFAELLTTIETTILASQFQISVANK